MQSEPVFEFRYVVISAFACFVWHVQCNAEVEAYDKEIEVMAYAYTSARSELLEDTVGLEFCSWSVVVVFHQPYIASIEECGSIEATHDIEAVFEVGLQLDVAGLVEICIMGVGRNIVAWTYAAYGKCPYAVGSSHIELLAVGGTLGVAVGHDNPCSHASHELRLWSE